MIGSIRIMKTVRRSRNRSRTSRNQISRTVDQFMRLSDGGRAKEKAASRPVGPVGVAERLGFDRAGGPVKREQPLEVVVAADVETADAVELALAGAVGVAAEGEWDAGGVPGQQLL